MKLRIYSLILIVFLASSCTSSFDDLNTNPDKTTQATSAMLATKLILGLDATSSPSQWQNEFLVKRIFWGEQMDNYQYNRIEKGTFEYITYLTNAQKMVDFSSESDMNGYTGLYYFIKGWYFYRATMDMGDIPYVEALDVVNHRFPKYDSQKDVFKYILDDLSKANDFFSKSKQSFNGDPFYNGEPLKWQKATNVLRLKVLMALQKRADDTPDLQVKETFASIVADNILFESNDDNLQKNYSDINGQTNPYHRSSTRSIEVYAGSKMIIDPLKEYKDYRLFYYFAPAQALVDPDYLPEGQTLLLPNDWNAYNGLAVEAPFDQEQKKIATYMHNRPNDVYRLSYVGVPCIWLGYADMNFIIAEAVERGWITGNAKEYYEKGIRASFEFVRKTVPSEYNNNMPITDEYIEAYLQGEHVAYKSSGNSNDRLKQIWMQTYLAGYFHMNRDAFYNHRRTGHPAFPINPETNLNDAKDKIPVRWLYPDNESTTNKEQLLIALRNQWGTEVEDVNRLMWVIK